MKKKILMALSYVLVIALTLGATIAYFTDKDSAVNVMTVGNIAIEQIEQERDETGALVEFTQAKQLMPAYTTDPNGSIPWAANTRWPVDNEAWKVVEDHDQVIDKFVTVKNTGDNEAYIRTIIAYEGDAINGKDIHVVHNTNTSSNPSVAAEFAAADFIENVVIGGVRYDLIVYTYADKIQPGETTIPSLKQIYMDKSTEQEDVEKFGDTYDVLVYTQAVQADMNGLGPVAALNEAFGAITASEHPWKDEAPVIPVYAYDVASLEKALSKGGVVTLTKDIEIPAGEQILVPKGAVSTLNLNGKTINSKASNYAIRNEGDLTVVGEGEVVGVFGAITARGKLTINSGSYKALGDAGKTHHCIYVGSGSDVVINGGTFSHTGAGTSDSGAVVTIYDYTANGVCDASLVINGGTFIGSGTYIRAIDKYDSESYLSIIGGTFSTKPQAAWVPSTCDVIQNADGTYSVTGKVIDTAEELEEFLTDAGAASAGDTVLDLNCDVDLTGESWTPIKVDGYHGADIVTIKGNGHTITGLSAPLFAGGFAGGSGIVIKDLTIADSNIVSTNTVGAGAFIESVDSMDTITLSNCHLINSTVTGSGGSRTGGLLGWTAGYSNVNDGPVKTYVTIENCSVIDSTIKSDGSVGGIYGHAGNNDWTYSVVKNCTVQGCDLISTNTSDWRVGVVVGTANVGEVTISGITASDNTLSQTGKTAPAGQSNLYGRFVPGSTGKLIIDGVEIGA